MKGVKYMLGDTLYRLINLELTEPNPLEKEGYEYGYAIFNCCQTYMLIVVNITLYPL